jgi:hypothetical protein
MRRKPIRVTVLRLAARFTIENRTSTASIHADPSTIGIRSATVATTDGKET